MKVEYPYVEGPTIKVRVRKDKIGEYEYARRRSGDVFVLKPRYMTVVSPKTAEVILEMDGSPRMVLLTAQEQFSPRWMERVNDNEVESTTSSPQALAQAQAELKGEQMPPSGPGRPRSIRP